MFGYDCNVHKIRIKKCKPFVFGLLFAFFAEGLGDCPGVVFAFFFGGNAFSVACKETGSKNKK